MYNLTDCSLIKFAVCVSMAAGLGLEPSHPVLETGALANILTRIIEFVCPKRQASFRFVRKEELKQKQMVGIVGFEPTLEGF